MIKILGRTSEPELDKMIGRINGECNLENCAKANLLQQQENEMETRNSKLLKVSISSFFFLYLYFTSLGSIQVEYSRKVFTIPNWRNCST